MREEEFDVLIIGAGITGAGAAFDAAARGLKVALVDKGDIAAGTSSKSSKLVHGGLRYLQQKEFRLVYENLAERQRLLKNAPHLVQPLPFLIPLFGKDGAVMESIAKAYNTALWLYDLTGGWRIGKRHRRLKKDVALAHMPTLRPDKLVAAFLYYDARADDARLTLALARSAAARGAAVVTYAGVSSFLRDGARVCGAILEDGTEVRAKAVVNATGVWADELQRLDGSGRAVHIRPAKGVHISVSAEKVRCDMAVVLPVPGDRRSIFAIPWDDVVYLGTTDTDYDGPIDSPTCTADDVEYILRAVNAVSSTTLTADDVVGTWAGLRPLVADEENTRTADMSRRHTVLVSPAGVITVTGGKLTNYRTMAADTVDEVVKRTGGPKRSPTKKLPVHGVFGLRDLRARDAASRLALTDEQLQHLVSRHGGEASAIAALIREHPALGAPLVEGLRYLKAEAVWAARHEMVNTLEDLLSRRTRALLLARDATVEAAPAIAALVAPELGWSDEDQAMQVAALQELAERERRAAAPVAGAAAPKGES
ncbi:MAG TPA: glycerol-3-phosphate dehydrogenase/oxidase [Acidimicrobiales bacterium]|nr:glycerol-3-phosphate dehydrogenase/oxidase [Acidimicrobiales bacterium]